MPQPQQAVTLAAPAFKGMNTEDSPLTLGPEWAYIAHNCVLDAGGRLAARKGHATRTTDNTALGSAPIRVIHEHITKSGTSIVISAGNNKIFTGTTTLTDVTPVGATITADDWQIVSLNDDCFLFQSGHAPIAYDHSTTTWDELDQHPLYSGSVPQGDVALAAYGRLWVASTTSDKSTVTWSDTLIGPAWTGGSSGSIDLTEAWPTGSDQIQALAAHNDYLIIFGKESILVYGSNASDGKLATPATDLVLVDTIVGIGCIGKHALAVVGPELMFVDQSGLRSLSRVVQEKSLPMGDISKNVKRDFQLAVRSADDVKVAYSQEEGFVLVTLGDTSQQYCFDMRLPLEDGSRRTTLWTGKDIYGIYTLSTGELYFGNNDGILEYGTYNDGDTGTYRFRYYSAPLDFGVPNRIKKPKNCFMTILGGPNQKATAYWGYDYKYAFQSHPFTLNEADLDYYNTEGDEWEVFGDDPVDPTEWVGGMNIERYKIPLTRSGLALTLGLEITVNGIAVTLQELAVMTLLGRYS